MNIHKNVSKNYLLRLAFNFKFNLTEKKKQLQKSNIFISHYASIHFIVNHEQLIELKTYKIDINPEHIM